MSGQTIRDAVIGLLVDDLGIAKVRVLEIDMATHITNDLGADSLSLFEIYASVEQRFGIEVPDEHVAAVLEGYGSLPFDLTAPLGTVGALCEYLERVGATPLPEPLHGW